MSVRPFGSPLTWCVLSLDGSAERVEGECLRSGERGEYAIAALMAMRRLTVVVISIPGLRRSEPAPVDTTSGRSSGMNDRTMESLCSEHCSQPLRQTSDQRSETFSPPNATTGIVTLFR